MFMCKYLALQILEKLIQTRWNALPREQCEGMGLKGGFNSRNQELHCDSCHPLLLERDNDEARANSS